MYVTILISRRKKEKLNGTDTQYGVIELRLARLLHRKGVLGRRRTVFRRQFWGQMRRMRLSEGTWGHRVRKVVDWECAETKIVLFRRKKFTVLEVAGFCQKNKYFDCHSHLFLYRKKV